MLTGAWSVLADGHPVAAAEIAAVVSTIVPRATSAGLRGQQFVGEAFARSPCRCRPTR